MNFVQSSISAFRSAKTSTLAKLVYTNLICGISTVAFVSTNMLNLAKYSSFVPLYYFSFGFVLVVPFVLNLFIRSLNNLAAYCLYYGYALAMGVFMSPYLGYYGGSKIAVGLLLTSLGFIAAVSVGGQSERTDTRSLFYGSLFLIGLAVLNSFLRLTLLELGVCSIGIALCIGYTSYLVGHVKQFASYDGPDVNRLAILISLSLLQQLTSLFLYILRFLDIVGGRKKN